MKRSTFVGLLALVLAGCCFAVFRSRMPAGSPAPHLHNSSLMPVDDFESGDLISAFGTRWEAYTDASQGGKSTVRIDVVDGGGAGTSRAMRITGQITADFRYGFAGAGVLFGGEEGIDLRRFEGLRFYARGDGGRYEIRLMTAAVKDHNEFAKLFSASSDWTLIEVPFSALAQSAWWGSTVRWTGSDITGLSFSSAGGPQRNYSLEVDEVSFYR
jgi:hypothetical protein